METTGKTKTAGYQFGIRKTFPMTAGEAWDFITSCRGLEVWLGRMDSLPPPGGTFETFEGGAGKVRVFKPYSHLRLNWRMPRWQSDSLVQLRVIDHDGRATISIHQEKLRDARQRSTMKAHWTEVMNRLSAAITTAPGPVPA